VEVSEAPVRGPEWSGTYQDHRLREWVLLFLVRRPRHLPLCNERGSQADLSGPGYEPGLRESLSSRREAGYGCGGFADGVDHPNAESVLVSGSMQVLVQFLKGDLLDSRFDSAALIGFRCR
jgi:hypothetical protein